MARPKGYDRDTVLAAARDLFWEQGYERVSVADLEQCTGLNRSGIYQEFGSKHGLFVAALDCYADRVIAGLLAGLRDDQAGGLDAVIGLFGRLAEMFRCEEGLPARGCLLVNTIAELAAYDAAVRAHAEAYRDRLRASFGAALTRAARLGEIAADPDHARARLLAAALMGVWLTVRIDPADASALCQTIARQVESWRAPAR